MKNLEIEKKYLVNGLPNLEKSEELYMSQYYGEGFRVRRIMDMHADSEKPVIYMLSNKTKLDDGVYEEYEEELTKEQFDEYVSKAEKYLVKIRHVYPREDGLKWEVDQYTEAIKPDEKMFTAEIEIPTKDHQFEIEPEMEEIIIEDVTEDDSYTNKSLALKISKDERKTDE